MTLDVMIGENLRGISPAAVAIADAVETAIDVFHRTGELLLAC